MFGKPAEYYRPATLDEALKYAASPYSIAISGGALTFVGVTLPYEIVVDLQDIVDLKGLQASDDKLYIGGGVSLQEVVDSDLSPARLKTAITRAVTLNHRNGASVGESMLAPNPPIEWLTALVALRTTVEHATESGVQAHPLLDVILNQKNFRKQGIITEIHVATLGDNDALGLAHVARTPAGEPIINAACVVRGDEKMAVFAIAGASTDMIKTFTLSIKDSPADDAMRQQLFALVQERTNPVDDYKGSAEYRLEMAKLCARRALDDCFEQLRN
jgi:CO/xanthine dehydrogenase FAD-binding subunit